MIKSIYLLTITLLFLCLHSCNNQTKYNEIVENEHFDYVLYNDLTVSNISGINRALEENYARIIDDLQVQRMPLVVVKIWADYDEFLNAMEADIGTRYTGATGYIISTEEIRIYFTNQAPLTAIHEFAHVVSMQINNTIPNNPRWLWEAVALYETREFVDPIILPYMVSGDYPTLQELNTDYNSSNHSIYSLGYVLLEYVINTWGMNTVIELVENNGDIATTLGITVLEFELGWYKYIEEEYLLS